MGIYLLALGKVIYRADPQFKWVIKKTDAVGDGTLAPRWRKLSVWNKILAVFGILVFIIIALYVPYKVILTSAYLSGDQMLNPKPGLLW